jgi:ketosteroid isomerase-like protein
MRDYFVLVCIAALSVVSLGGMSRAQQPTMPTEFGEGTRSGPVSTDPKSKEMWESKIKLEWEAIKNKDKKAYADLLADDYQGVEVDGRGERNKVQAINELVADNVFTYTLFGFKLIPLEPDAAFLTYEVTMQFPPKAQVRYSRVYITELWMKRAGQWKEVHYQETHVK